MAKANKNDDPRNEVRKQAVPRSRSKKQVASPVPFHITVPARTQFERDCLRIAQSGPQMRVLGPLFPPRVKGRSKRGWTTAKVAA